MADGRYYRISPKFWADPMVLAWDDDTRLLALYLLTCPHRTTEGLFRLPKLYAVADLGWSTQRFDKGFARLVHDGFVEWDPDAEVVLVVKALVWQSPDNPNQVKGAVRQLAMVPETPLKSRFRALAERYCERLAEGLPEGFGERSGEPQPPSQPQPPSPTQDASDDADAPDEDGSTDESADRFDEHFWPVYPPTNGVKREKAAARREFCKLSLEDQRAAVRGAKHKAAHFDATGEQPPYAVRFLRNRVFDDFQHPPAVNGRSRASPAADPPKFATTRRLQ